MDDAEVFPLIAPHDYAAFKLLLGVHLPDTYDEWRALQKREIREFIQAGRKISEVSVHSDSYASFLSIRGAVANLVSLRNFTIEIDAGQDFNSAIHR